MNCRGQLVRETAPIENRCVAREVARIIGAIDGSGKSSGREAHLAPSHSSVVGRKRPIRHLAGALQDALGTLARYATVSPNAISIIR